RSTGAAFAAPASWGGNGVCRVDPGLFRWRTGDFNGDGRTDLACQRVALNGNLDGVWVGLSTGASFSHARWTEACDAATDLVSAADFDGDGRSDWQCIHPDGAVTILIARGAAFAGGFGVAGGACPAEA